MIWSPRNTSIRARKWRRCRVVSGRLFQWGCRTRSQARRVGLCGPDPRRSDAPFTGDHATELDGIPLLVEFMHDELGWYPSGVDEFHAGPAPAPLYKPILRTASERRKDQRISSHTGTPTSGRTSDIGPGQHPVCRVWSYKSVLNTSRARGRSPCVRWALEFLSHTICLSLQIGFHYGEHRRCHLPTPRARGSDPRRGRAGRRAGGAGPHRRGAR